MVTYTSRNDLSKPDYGDAADIAVLNADLDIIDASIAKHEWAKAAAPTANDDSGDGYVVGSLWFDTTASYLYICEDNTLTKAVWDQIYPQGSSAHAAAADPTVNDDEGDGYVIGSMWVNTDTDDVFIAADVTTGKAVWQQVYPGGAKSNATGADPTANDDTLDGYSAGSVWVNTTDDTAFTAVDVTAAKAIWKKHLFADGTVPLTAAWDAGSYQIRAETFQSDVATGTAPFTVASTTQVTNLNAASLNGVADTGFVKQSLADAKGDIIIASAADTWARMAGATINGSKLVYWDTQTNNAYWETPWQCWMQIDATRVSDTSFKVSDVGGAIGYGEKWRHGTYIRWAEAAADKLGMLTSSGTNAKDETTFPIVGDTMASIDADSLRVYCGPAMVYYHDFVIPGTQAVATDVSHTWYTPYGLYPLAAFGWLKTAGVTNSGTWDINDDGTTMFGGTAVTIATTATASASYTAAAAPTTSVATGSLITVDTTAISTTPGVEATIRFFYMPYAIGQRLYG